MNENLKNLMFEAGYINPDRAANGQNLAALLIQYCCEVADTVQKQGCSTDTIISKLIKENFGINE